MAKTATFTIDWEVWNSFDPNSKWSDSQFIDEPTHYLLDLLHRHDIKAIWFTVGWLADRRPNLLEKIKSDGHKIGYHSYFHRHDPADIPPDNFYRAPRFKGQKRLYSGGFWFRLMPYWWIKREVEKTGTLYIHPHDILFKHPACGIRTFDRRIGLKTSRDKLERLCREIKWNDPNG